MKQIYYFLFALIALFAIPLTTNDLRAQDGTWFEEITAEVGLDSLNTSKIQCVDINGDNYPDLYLGTGGLIKGHSNTFTLLLNVSDPDNPEKRVFVDFTEESGLEDNRDPDKPYREYDVGIMGDLDNDGDLDVVNSFYYHRLEWYNPEHNEKSEVYLNDGTGHFTLKRDAGLYNHKYFPALDSGIIDAVGLSLLDYDLDGVLDLYMATKFVDYKYGVYFPDILMKGNGDGSFTEDKDAGSRDIAEPLYGVNVTDYNNDGLQDVITSPYCRTGGRILENLGNGTFLDVANEVNYSAHTYGGDTYRDPDDNKLKQQALCQWESPPADFDNDGDMDLLQCLIHGGYETIIEGSPEGHTHVTINQGPPDYKFEANLNLIHRDADKRSHLGDYGGLWTDFQNDGLLDIVICQGHYYPSTDRVYMCVQRDGEFYDVSDELGLLYLKDAANAISCDYDLDGDNDIFVFCDGALHLLENKIGDQSEWISVKLNAPEGCNQSAIGARITVCADTVNQIREIQTGRGHFGGQKPFIKNFGLADMPAVDSIIVRWPMTGSPRTVVQNPPTDIIVTVDSEGYEGYVKTWEGDKPIAKFSKTRINFGDIDVGDSATSSFKIQNIGEAPLEVKSWFLENEEPAAFEITVKETPFIVQPEGEEEIDVKFKPSKRKYYNPLVSFVTNAVNSRDTIKSFEIRGYGYEDQPLIAFSEKEIYFDSTETIAEKQTWIKNIGELPLALSDIQIINDSIGVFSIAEPPDVSEEIAPNDSAYVTIAFEPEFRKDYEAELKITSNAYRNENYYVAIYGIGDAPTPEIKLRDIFVSFGTVTVGIQKDETVEIENKGDGELIINNFDVEGNEDGAYTFPDLEGENTTVTIPPYESRDLTARFEPKAEKSYNRKALLYSNDNQTPTVSPLLRGKGEAVSVEEDKFYSNGELKAKIAPNPIEDKAVLQYFYSKNHGSSLSVSVYSAEGKMIEQAYYGYAGGGEKSIDLDLSNLNPGAYFLAVNCDGKKLTIPIVVIGR